MATEVYQSIIRATEVKRDLSEEYLIAAGYTFAFFNRDLGSLLDEMEEFVQIWRHYNFTEDYEASYLASILSGDEKRALECLEKVEECIRIQADILDFPSIDTEDRPEDIKVPRAVSSKSVVLRKLSEVESVSSPSKIFARVETPEMDILREEDLLKCEYCQESISSDPFALDCLHVFHHNCISSQITSQINKGIYPLFCIRPGCDYQIHERDLKELSQDIRHLFETLSLHHALKDQETTCPICRYPIYANESKLINCPHCNEEVCLLCNVPYHLGKSCQQFQASLNKEI